MHNMSRAADILGRDDRQRRERLQRVLQRLNRLHDPTYGERIPSHNSLYDWAPASEGEDEEAELQSIQREIRQLHPNTHPEVLRVLAQTQLDERRSNRQTSRFLNSHTTSHTEGSLRSTAILQAVRRHPRFSARSREYMQRYMDRADRWAVEDDDDSRSGLPEETRPTVALPPTIPPRDSLSPALYHSASTSSTRPRMRRAILQDPSCNSTDPSMEWLGQTITYLANLRTCNAYEDSLGHAVDAGFVTKEFFGARRDDFVLDINNLPSTFETSLLTPGTILEGQQRANPDITNHPVQSRSQDWRLDSSTSARREQFPRLPLDDAIRDSSVPPHAQRARRPVTDKFYTPDSWPVRVTIHAVDYEKMTLAATMEAYDVPSHPPDLISTIPLVLEASATRTAPSTLLKKKSITTYLEGEILDFRTHTLLTETFASTPTNDATYWRKLEPFRHLTDEEIVRKLVSKSFHKELSRSYIFMRWKERCFVRDGRDAKGSPRNSTEGAPQRAAPSSNLQGASGADWYDSAEMADGCGLTISGFYYVCLRRSDGSVEGLYCDPHSSPYQHLTLERQQKFSQFPVWSFK
jgi:hypothetical protein